MNCNVKILWKIVFTKFGGRSLARRRSVNFFLSFPYISLKFFFPRTASNPRLPTQILSSVSWKHLWQYGEQLKNAYEPGFNVQGTRPRKTCHDPENAGNGIFKPLRVKTSCPGERGMLPTSGLRFGPFLRCVVHEDASNAPGRVY